MTNQITTILEAYCIFHKYRVALVSSTFYFYFIFVNLSSLVSVQNFCCSQCDFVSNILQLHILLFRVFYSFCIQLVKAFIKERDGVFKSQVYISFDWSMQGKPHSVPSN